MVALAGTHQQPTARTYVPQHVGMLYGGPAAQAGRRHGAMPTHLNAAQRQQFVALHNEWRQLSGQYFQQEGLLKTAGAKIDARQGDPDASPRIAEFWKAQGRFNQTAAKLVWVDAQLQDFYRPGGAQSPSDRTTQARNAYDQATRQLQQIEQGQLPRLDPQLLRQQQQPQVSNQEIGRIAHDLHEAVTGGMVGGGTDDDKLWAVLEGKDGVPKTRAVWDRVRAAYKDHYDSDLDADIKGDLEDPDEALRAEALLRGTDDLTSAGDAAAARLHQLKREFKPDDVLTLLRDASPGQREALRQGYQRLYEADLLQELGPEAHPHAPAFLAGDDWAEAQALFSPDSPESQKILARAAARRVHESLNFEDGWLDVNKDIDIRKLQKALEGWQDPQRLQQLKDAYKALYDGADLEADLKRTADDDTQRDQALVLLNGRSGDGEPVLKPEDRAARVDALELRSLGDDAEDLREKLEALGPQAVAAAVEADPQLAADLKGRIDDGHERAEIMMLLDDPRAAPPLQQATPQQVQAWNDRMDAWQARYDARRTHRALDGLNDEDLLRQIYKGASGEHITRVMQEYKSLYGRDVREDLKGELGERDEQEIVELYIDRRDKLNGSPKSDAERETRVEEELQRLQLRSEFEGDSGFTTFMQKVGHLDFGYKGDAQRLRESIREVRQALKDGDLDRAELLIGLGQGDADALVGTKQSAAETAAMAAGTVAAVAASAAVIAVTAGTATPLVVGAWAAGAGAVGAGGTYYAVNSQAGATEALRQGGIGAVSAIPFGGRAVTMAAQQAGGKLMTTQLARSTAWSGAQSGALAGGLMTGTDQHTWENGIGNGLLYTAYGTGGGALAGAVLAPVAQAGLGGAARSLGRWRSGAPDTPPGGTGPDGSPVPGPAGGHTDAPDPPEVPDGPGPVVAAVTATGATAGDDVVLDAATDATASTVVSNSAASNPGSSDAAAATAGSNASANGSQGTSGSTGSSDLPGYRRDRTAAFGEFRATVAQLDPNEAQLLGMGAGNIVYRIEVSGQRYAVRVGSIEEGSVEALMRAEGLPHVPRLIALDEPSQTMVMDVVPGTAWADMPYSTRASIPQEHYDQLLDTVLALDARGLSIDPGPGNFLHSPQAFGVVDFNLKPGARSTGDQVMSLGDMLLSRPLQGVDDRFRIGTPEFNAWYRDHVMNNVRVFNRYLDTLEGRPALLRDMASRHAEFRLDQGLRSDASSRASVQAQQEYVALQARLHRLGLRGSLGRADDAVPASTPPATGRGDDFQPGDWPDVAPGLPLWASAADGDATAAPLPLWPTDPAPGGVAPARYVGASDPDAPASLYDAMMSGYPSRRSSGPGPRWEDLSAEHLLLPLDDAGAGFYRFGDRTYFVDTAGGTPVDFATAVGRDKLGAGAFKDALPLGDRWVLTRYRDPDIGTPSFAHDEALHPQRLREAFDAHRSGAGSRYVLSDHGPIVLPDGSVGIVTPRAVAFSKDPAFRRLAQGEPLTAEDRLVLGALNQNTLDDLAEIERLLLRTGLYVDDLDFAIFHDGHVAIADPAQVLPLAQARHSWTGLSGWNRNEPAIPQIEALRAAARQHGAQNPSSPAILSDESSIHIIANDGSALYRTGDDILLVGELGVEPISLARALQEEPRWSGREKDAYTVGDKWVVTAYRSADPSESLAAAQQQVTALKNLKSRLDAYRRGLGDRFVVSEHGPMVLPDGRIGLLTRRYAGSSNDDEFVNLYIQSRRARFPGMEQAVADLPPDSVVRLANQNTLDDITLLRQALKETDTDVGDLQFLLTRDGHLVIADPSDLADVAPGATLQLPRSLDFLESVARANARQALPMWTPAHWNDGEPVSMAGQTRQPRAPHAIMAEPGDELHAAASALEVPDGYDVVVVRGLSDGSVEHPDYPGESAVRGEIAGWLQHRQGLDLGQRPLLLVGNRAALQAGQDLASYLGVPVVAPRNALERGADGRLLLTDAADWRRFNPVRERFGDRLKVVNGRAIYTDPAGKQWEVPIESLLGKRLGSGKEKDVYQLGDKAVGVMSERRVREFLSDVHMVRDPHSEMPDYETYVQQFLLRLARAEQENLRRLGEKLPDNTNKVLGLTTIEGRPALVYDEVFAETGHKLVQGRGPSVLNERSLRDIDLIERVLREERIYIPDIEVFAAPNGRIVLADPLEDVVFGATDDQLARATQWRYLQELRAAAEGSVAARRHPLPTRGLVDPPDDPLTIRRFSAEELPQYRLEVRDNRFYDANGRPFDTGDNAQTMVVMDENGHLYGYNEAVPRNNVRHSSFGVDAVAAMNMRFNDGRLVYADNVSGRMRTTRAEFMTALNVLKDRHGVVLDDVEIKPFNPQPRTAVPAQQPVEHPPVQSYSGEGSFRDITFRYSYDAGTGVYKAFGSRGDASVSFTIKDGHVDVPNFYRGHLQPGEGTQMLAHMIRATGVKEVKSLRFAGVENQDTRLAYKAKQPAQESLLGRRGIQTLQALLGRPEATAEWEFRPYAPGIQDDYREMVPLGGSLSLVVRVGSPQREIVQP